MRAFISAVLATAVVGSIHIASAAPPALQVALDPQPVPADSGTPLPPALPPPPRDDMAAHMDGARFSGTRFVVEILAGGAVGSLAAYATYESMCSGNDCLGAALAGFGVNFAVTPLAVYGVGKWMGGEGTVGWTYLGASTALSPFGVTGPADESPADTLARIDVEFAVSTLLLPVTSALFYELSSHLHYNAWRASHPGGMSAGIAPVYGHHRVSGAVGQLSLAF